MQYDIKKRAQQSNSDSKQKVTTFILHLSSVQSHLPSIQHPSSLVTLQIERCETIIAIFIKSCPDIFSEVVESTKFCKTQSRTRNAVMREQHVRIGDLNSQGSRCSRCNRCSGSSDRSSIRVFEHLESFSWKIHMNDSTRVSLRSLCIMLTPFKE